jgi:hypothetical protein
MIKKLGALALFVTLLAVTPAFAQDGGQGGRRAGRQFGGFGQRAQGGQILFRQDVQADLQLTSEQKAKLDALQETMRARRRDRNGGDQGQRPSREEMQARRAEQEKQFAAILTAEQTKRLGEIRIQLQGDMAVADPEVQKSLGLTDAQKTQVQSLQEKYREAMASVREKTQSGELDRQKARETMEQNSKVLGAEMKKILTAAQAEKLAALAGKPFKADEPVRR